MPYIKEEDREQLDKHIDELANRISFMLCKIPEDRAEHIGGIMNYVISRLFIKVISLHWGKLRYWMINMVSGTCSDVSSEFYRRTAAPYEDAKIEENGDIGYDKLL
jgi:hypothetical protein